MTEVLIKTHLIVTDIHEEYSINWSGKILDAKPKFKNNKPIFVIVASGGRMEVNTADMSRVERCAKLLTTPKGRQAITTDKAYIYILEENDHEMLLGTLTHNHVKSYAPMYDKVGYE